MNSMNLMINTQANPASAGSRQSGKQAQLPDFSFESKLAQQTQAQPLVLQAQTAGQQAKASAQQAVTADASADTQAQAVSKLSATQGDTAKADVVQTAVTAADASLSDKQLKALEELAVQVAAAPNAKKGEKDTSEWQQMLALLQMVLGPQVSQLLTDQGVKSPSGQLLTQLQQSAAQAAQQTPVGMEKLLTLLQPLAADSKEAQQMQAWVQQVLHQPTSDAVSQHQTGQSLQLAQLLQQLQTVSQDQQPTNATNASAKLLQALQQPTTQQQNAAMTADVRQPVQGALAQLTAKQAAAMIMPQQGTAAVQPQTATQMQQSAQTTEAMQEQQETAVQVQQPVQLATAMQAQQQTAAQVQQSVQQTTAAQAQSQTAAQAQQPGAQAVLPEVQLETVADAGKLQDVAASQPLTTASETVHTVLVQQPMAAAVAATQQRETEAAQAMQPQTPATEQETVQPVAVMSAMQTGSQSMAQSGQDESSLFQQQNQSALPSDTPLAQEAESAPTPGMSHEATAAAGSSSFAAQLQQAAQPEAQATQAAPAPVQQDYDVPQQILSQARLIRRGQDTQMVIHLHPEHLGDLTLKVAVGVDGAVNASFHSNNAEVRTIIQNSLAALRQDLNNHGLRVDNVDVYAGLDGGLPQQDSGQQGWQQQGGQQQSTASGHAQAYADEKELHEAVLQQTTATAAPQSATATGAVDYRV